MHQFRLGPIGGLRALPSPSLGSGPEASATRHGAVHRSLSGRTTVDRLALTRTWVLTWPYLDQDTAVYLDALHLGLVAGPLWLIDPQRPNRLPSQIAATGSATRTTSGFTASEGTLAWTAAVPRSTLPLAGGLSWQVPATGGQIHIDPVPVIAGEAVTVSVWAASTVVPVRLLVAFYDAADDFLSFAQSTPTTPGAAGARLTLTATAGAAAAVARVAVTASPTSAGGTVTTTAWQLEPGPAVTPWSPGGGSAQVVLDALTTSYPIPGAWATTVTLLEV